MMRDVQRINGFYTYKYFIKKEISRFAILPFHKWHTRTCTPYSLSLMATHLSVDDIKPWLRRDLFILTDQLASKIIMNHSIYNNTSYATFIKGRCMEPIYDGSFYLSSPSNYCKHQHVNYRNLVKYIPITDEYQYEDINKNNEMNALKTFDSILSELKTFNC